MYVIKSFKSLAGVTWLVNGATLPDGKLPDEERADRVERGFIVLGDAPPGFNQKSVTFPAGVSGTGGMTADAEPVDAEPSSALSPEDVARAEQQIMDAANEGDLED